MLPSFLLSLREGLEAALIVGIVLGALRQMRRSELAPPVWWGVAAASLVSIVAGVILTALGLGLEEPYEQIFEGVTMLLAAGILTWMIFWMSRQSRQMKGELEAGVRQAVAQSGSALFALAFFAVVREGIELALFLTASAFASDAVQTIIGAILGLFTAILLGWSLFASTLKLDLRRFFQITGVLLILFAAGLFTRGMHEFIEIGWLPALVEHVWDLNPLISEPSLLGQVLKVLFGYNPNPSLTEMIAYLAYFAAIFLGLRTLQKREAVAVSQAN
jgi:high-affinity iron transporter